MERSSSHRLSADGTPAERRRQRRIARGVKVIVPLGIVWLIGFVFVGFLVIQDVPSEELFLDVSYSTGAEWYTGTVSSLGVLGWSLGMISSAWGSFVARLGGRSGAADFLRAGTVVSAVMLIDDLFLVHSAILNEQLGYPKVLGIAIVMGTAVLWLAQFPRELRRTRYEVLAAAFVMLAASVAIDQAPFTIGPEGSLVLEDGAKFLGIQAWALYFLLTSADVVRSVLADAIAMEPTRRNAATGEVVPIEAAVTDDVSRRDERASGTPRH